MKNYRDNLRIIQSSSLLEYDTIKDIYMIPVNLFRITQFYKQTENKKIIDLKPQYIIDKIENILNNRLFKIILNKNLSEIDRKIKYLFEIALYEYLAPKICIFNYNLNKEEFDNMISEIELNFIKAIIEPGEMVGMIAAQTLGEPTTQLSITSDTKIKIIIKNKRIKIRYFIKYKLFI